MSPVIFVSFFFQALFFLVLEFMPPVQPERIKKTLMYVFTVIPFGFTYFGIPLYPRAESVGSMLVVAISLVAFALVSPFAGLLESKFKSDGQSIYSTDRFPGHLLTNILGALASSAYLWVAHSTIGFNEWVPSFRYNAAYNLMLPLSMIVVFSFVRWQQKQACPNIDEVVNQSGWEVKITGFSLRHWHQLTNVLYLIVVTFIGSTTFLYLVTYAIEHAKAKDPLAVSWQVILTILVSLSYLYACGSPWSRQYRAVYLTFLTGTPAALIAVIVWLLCFRDDAIRKIALMSIVGIGYVMYCVEVVFASLALRERPRLHDFSVVGVTVVLAILLGTLYWFK